MLFTYDSYMGLINQLRDCGYEIANYQNWQSKSNCVILRHDIDFDIEKAVKMASLEQNGGVSSTYFVLLTSDFYNVFSRESVIGLKKILKEGHTIGLHFDEVRYPECVGDVNCLRKKIIWEMDILSQAVGDKISIVSMHRPSSGILEANIEISDAINSYGQTYFKDFKYLSDSRRRWREPIDEIIGSKQFDRLHILTHPFWYNKNEVGLHDAICEFVNRANHDRYKVVQSNITDMSTIMQKEEVI